MKGGEPMAVTNVVHKEYTCDVCGKAAVKMKLIDLLNVIDEYVDKMNPELIQICREESWVYMTHFMYLQCY